jgi:phage gpG-like protein
MADKLLLVHFEDRKVRRALRKMGDNCKALGKVFRHLRPVLREDLQSHAEREESPAGGRWPARAASTLARLEKRAGTHTRVKRDRRQRKLKGGARFSGPQRETRISRKMTSLLGKLPIGVKTSARGQSSLEAASPVAWAGVHNDGGTAGRGSRIPQREFVAFSGDFLAEASEDLVAFVHAGWRKA